MKQLFIKSIFRRLTKNLSFSLINIFGLAIGLASSLIIFLWVTNENSYDKFHSKYHNIYRIMSYGTTYFTEGIIGTPFPLSEAIKAELPEVKQTVRFVYPQRFNFKYNDKKFYEDKAIIVDSMFFNLFDFELIKGDPKSVLREPNTIIITEAMAKRYFGSDDPMGKVLEMDEDRYTVNGILKNIPKNSTLQFDFIIPLVQWEKFGYPTHNWGMFMAHSFIELPENVNILEIEEKLTQIALNYECPQVKNNGVVFKLQPMSEIHLDGKHGFYLNYIDLGSKKTVLIFTSIALMLLFLATINYINLSTADSDEKSKEIGLKKILGSPRKDLIKHIYLEGFITIFIAFDFALLFIEMMLPVFNNLAGRELVFTDLFRNGFVFFLSGIFIITWLVAGSYPAFYLSSLKSNKILNASNKFNISRPNSIFRKVLVAFQFIVSIALIISTITIYKQMLFIKNKDVGFDNKNIVYVPLKGEFATNFELIKNRLLDDPNIMIVSNQDYLWAAENNRTTGFDWDGKDPEFSIDMLIPKAGFDYLKLLNMKIITGRDFDSKFRTDSTEAFILSETAVIKMGISDPIGKGFKLYNGSKWQEGNIVGVVKDINYKSLRQEIEPFVMRVLAHPENNTTYGVMLIKHANKKSKEVVNYTKKIWEEVNSGIPFEYNILEETYENLYEDENKTGRIIMNFSVLAILISCLGLFGLTSFMVDKRTKEIGIRKVNGATSTNIVLLFIGEFVKLILIAYVIAVPIAYYFMNNWLNRFVFKTDLSIPVFIIALIIILFVSSVAIIFKSIKVSNQNPTESLRYE
ncbi:MAG: ABC transporter permease [Bacteroidales bacterium]|nr:ABC transporter permease [Bacteroidales bacterium]